MQISYLLDAYRRLERASNRPLTPGISSELEGAVSDVILLGSTEEAALAVEFCTRFAEDHAADAQPLLLALRASLRRELLIGELPSEAYVSLRIGDHGDSAVESARIWHATVESTRQVVLDAEGIDPATLDRAGRLESVAASGISPNAVVAQSAARVEHLLRELLAGTTAEDARKLPMPQLASRALQLGRIDAKLADSINGLSVMRILAAMDQDRLTGRRAAEFASLGQAVEYLLQVALRTSRPASQ
jgi:hypothetical protein